MVRWGFKSICDCSAAQSAVCLSKCLAAAPVFSLRSNPACKICAEIVFDQMFAVFLNGLNGKDSSRIIARNNFFIGFKISYSVSRESGL